MHARSKRARRRLAAATLGACLMAVSPAAADTFKPTRFDDPSPGKCKPHDCSLREAVKAANEDVGRDEIVLRRGRYELEITEGDAYEEDGLDVYTKTHIRGVGREKTKVDANGIDRPIEIGAGIGPPGPVTIEALTLTGGDAGADPHNGDSSGGGVVDYYGPRLVLRNVLITGNEAVYGGGVRSFAERLVIENSTIAGNNAAEGGGIDLRAGTNQPRNTIRSTTISGNFASKGGGILADGFVETPDHDPPTLKVTNSTIADNSASGAGGGVMADNAAVVTLDNSTLAYNLADDDSTGGGAGGGVHQLGAAVFEIPDTIVAANNVGASGEGAQCAGAFTGAPGTLIGHAGDPAHGCGVTAHFAADARIGPLADNGGPTRTIKLLSRSPAISIVGDCPARDQRGKPRPQTGGCDSGAFERKGP